jgi:hypothetical protein
MEFRDPEPTDLIRGMHGDDTVAEINGIAVALIGRARDDGSCWYYPLVIESGGWRRAALDKMLRFETRGAAIAWCHRQFHGRLMRVS